MRIEGAEDRRALRMERMLGTWRIRWIILKRMIDVDIDLNKI